MAFKFNDIELTSSSAVGDATDSADGVSFDIVVAASERRTLAELFAHAGRVQTFTLALGESFAVDPTGGLNTIYVSSGATSQVDSGWFAVRSVSDSWQQRVTHARMRVDLAKLAGTHDAVGESSGFTQFLSHDF